MKVRIKFSKYSSMIFIGHLDMMRYFQKAIRRAELDITYSTGFSPHQIMSFAAPLGVGMYSNGEYMDIGMDSVTDAEDIKERLQAQMVEGVDILSVTILPEMPWQVLLQPAIQSVSAKGMSQILSCLTIWKSTTGRKHFRRSGRQRKILWNLI